MENTLKYREVIANNQDLKLQDGSFESQIQILKRRAGAAFANKKEYIHPAVCWWMEKEYSLKLESCTGKKARTTKKGRYSAFYLLQECYQVQNYLVAKSLFSKIEEAWKKYRDLKKSHKKQEDKITALPVKELSENKAKEAKIASKGKIKE